MTTILIIAGTALLFVIVFLTVFAICITSEINELEMVVNELMIEVKTVGTIAADTKFANDDLRAKLDNAFRYGEWDD